MKTSDALKWGLLLGIGYAAWRFLRGGTDYVASVAASVSDAIGAEASNLINGDANAQAQDAFHQIMAALKTAGNPTVGSAAYNQVMLDNGRPDLVVNLPGG